MRATVLVYDISGTPTVINSFLPFDDSFRGGVSVDLGRVNQDATPDLIVGAGYRGQSMVEVYDGDTRQRLTSFQAFQGTSVDSPARVAVRDTDNDGIVDRILTVQGPDGAVNQIRAYDLVFGNDQTLSAVLNPAASVDLDALGDDDLFGAYFL